MWVLIIVIIGAILFYQFGKNTGNAIGSVQSSGGMRLKYAKLIKNILDGNKDCRIMLETKTYIRVGVSNYGGSTIFHIQQLPNNQVMIDYDVSNNPVIPDFSLRFRFPDYMDQDKMIEEIGLGVQKKMLGY